MLDILAKLLKALNAEGSPSQISLGFAAGMILGLTPLWSLHNLLLVFLVLCFRINLSAFLLSWTFFSAVAYLLDPFMNSVGNSLLTSPTLSGLWTTLYNSQIWRLSHFNNTLTLGSLLCALLLSVPLFIASNIIIKKYRDHVLQWVRKSKIVQFITASRFYRAYEALGGGGDA